VSPSTGDSTPDSEQRAYSSWFLRGLIVLFLMQASVNAVRPFVSYRALDLGANAAELGLIAAGFAMLSFVVAIPVGRTIDRSREIPFIVGGLALVCSVGFALALVDSIWALIVTQAVLGLGQVLNVLGMQALIANSAAQHRDSRFSAFTVVVSLGQLVGPAAAGFISQHTHVPGERDLPHAMSLAGTSVFLTAGFAALVGCGLASYDRNRGSDSRRGSWSPEAHGSILRGVGKVLTQPNAPHAMFASIAVLTSTDLLVAYLPAYGEAHGLSATTVGLLLSARAGASLVSRMFLQPMTRLIGRGRLLVVSTAIPAITVAPIPLLDSVPLLFAIMVAAGFGLGLGQPLSLIWIAETAPADMRGTAVGVRLSGNRLGQVAIPAIVGGVVGSTGIGAVFVAMAIMLAGSSVLTANGSFPPPD
jgi:MFS family permease